VSISTSVDTSLNFGVKPARTTLSDVAMISMQSLPVPRASAAARCNPPESTSREPHGAQGDGENRF
jgi:hypothetical protein